MDTLGPCFYTNKYDCYLNRGNSMSMLKYKKRPFKTNTINILAPLTGELAQAFSQNVNDIVSFIKDERILTGEQSDVISNNMKVHDFQSSDSVFQNIVEDLLSKGEKTFVHIGTSNQVSIWINLTQSYQDDKRNVPMLYSTSSTKFFENKKLNTVRLIPNDVNNFKGFLLSYQSILRELDTETIKVDQIEESDNFADFVDFEELENIEEVELFEESEGESQGESETDSVVETQQSEETQEPTSKKVAIFSNDEFSQFIKELYQEAFPEHEIYEKDSFNIQSFKNAGNDVSSFFVAGNFNVVNLVEGLLQEYPNALYFLYDEKEHKFSKNNDNIFFFKYAGQLTDSNRFRIKIKDKFKSFYDNKVLSIYDELLIDILISLKYLKLENRKPQEIIDIISSYGKCTGPLHFDYNGDRDNHSYIITTMDEDSVIKYMNITDIVNNFSSKENSLLGLVLLERKILNDAIDFKFIPDEEEPILSSIKIIDLQGNSKVLNVETNSFTYNISESIFIENEKFFIFVPSFFERNVNIKISRWEKIDENDISTQGFLDDLKKFGKSVFEDIVEAGESIVVAAKELIEKVDWKNPTSVIDFIKEAAKASLSSSEIISNIVGKIKDFNPFDAILVIVNSFKNIVINTWEIFEKSFSLVYSIIAKSPLRNILTFFDFISNLPLFNNISILDKLFTLISKVFNNNSQILFRLLESFLGKNNIVQRYISGFFTTVTNTTFIVSGGLRRGLKSEQVQRTVLVEGNFTNLKNVIQSILEFVSAKSIKNIFQTVFFAVVISEENLVRLGELIFEKILNPILKVSKVLLPKIITGFEPVFRFLLSSKIWASSNSFSLMSLFKTMFNVEENIDNIKNFLKQIFKGIPVDGLLKFFMFEDIFSILFGDLGTFSEFLGGIQDLFNNSRSTSEIIKFFVQIFKNFVTNFSKFKQTFNFVMNIFTLIKDKIASSITSILNEIYISIFKVLNLQEVFEDLQELVDIFVVEMYEIYKDFSEDLNEIWTKIFDLMTEFFAIFNIDISVFKDIFGNIVAKIIDILAKAAVNIRIDVLTTIGRKIMTVIGKILPVISDALEMLSNIASKISTIISIGGALVDNVVTTTLKDILLPIIKSIFGSIDFIKIGDIPIGSFTVNAQSGNPFKENIKKLYIRALQIFAPIINVFNLVINQLNDLMLTLFNAIRNLTEDADQIIESIMDGVIGAADFFAQNWPFVESILSSFMTLYASDASSVLDILSWFIPQVKAVLEIVKKYLVIAVKFMNTFVKIVISIMNLVGEPIKNGLSNLSRYVKELSDKENITNEDKQEFIAEFESAMVGDEYITQDDYEELFKGETGADLDIILAPIEA